MGPDRSPAPGAVVLDSLDPEPCAGVYAEVLRPGRIRTGDPVRLA